MAEQEEVVTADKSVVDRMDINGDGHISQREMELDLEFKRKEYEDADAMRDAQRNMAWFALLGMLVYPLLLLVLKWQDTSMLQMFSEIWHRPILWL